MPDYENIKFELFIRLLIYVKFCTALWKPLTNRRTSCTKKQVVCVIRIVLLIINKFKSHIIHTSRMHIISVLIQELSGTAQSHVYLLMLSASSLKTMSEITVSYYFPLTFSHSFILSLSLCTVVTDRIWYTSWIFLSIAVYMLGWNS
jgi:hypothetical protein